MQLHIKIENKYGNDLIYPCCDNSKLICQLLGTKTIPNDKAKILKELGYTFTKNSLEYDSQVMEILDWANKTGYNER